LSFGGETDEDETPRSSWMPLPVKGLSEQAAVEAAAAGLEVPRPDSTVEAEEVEKTSLGPRTPPSAARLSAVGGLAPSPGTWRREKRRNANNAHGGNGAGVKFLNEGRDDGLGKKSVHDEPQGVVPAEDFIEEEEMVDLDGLLRF